MSAPDVFCCPITNVLMKDPVCDPEGNTYERAAITQWLERNATSPVTRSPLRLDQLVPNRALKAAIDEYRARQAAGAGGAGAGAASASAAAPAPVTSPEEAEKGMLQRALERGLAVLGVGGNNQEQEPVPGAVHASATNTGAASSGVTFAQPSRGGVGVSMLAQAVPRRANEIDVLVRALAPKGARRTPVDVACVIDVSGSMCGAAKVEGVSAAEAQLSLLDVVKHAVSTIVNVLGDNDRLALVAYSDKAKIVSKLAKVSKANRKVFQKAIDQLRPGGQTNLWDGLVQGMDVLRTAAKPGRIPAVFLLTDGCPNVVPPRGHLPMLRRYRDTHSWLPAVSTFGFGYNLDSPLLNELAVEGGGTYCFIPDSGFVGTAFVHATSNLLSTMAHSVKLNLEPLAGAELVLPGAEGKAEEDDEGDALVTRTSWGAAVRLDTLQYGQSRDYVVRLRVPGGMVPGTAYLAATLNYRPWDATKAVTQTVEGPAAVAPSADVTLHAARCAAADSIRRMASPDLTLGHKRTTLYSVLENQLRAAGKSKVARDLLKDVTGQVKLALSKAKFYDKWGKHYLPSLAQAHGRQLCNNFKDPGVQHYGGALFTSLRDKADETFLKLPPPKPSRAPAMAPSVPGRRGSRSHRAAPAPRRVDMSAYHNARGGCWAGFCDVSMADGSVKPAANVKAGDRVATPSGAGATVVCVMKTHYKAGQADVTELPGGLVLTPWHPVRVSGKWQFPCQVKGGSTTTRRDIDAVYSYALDNEHVAVVNGVEAVCLAHGITGDAVVSHPYFGTQAVLDELKAMRGWSDGLVELHTPCTVRDSVTGMIVGMVQRASL